MLGYLDLMDGSGNPVRLHGPDTPDRILKNVIGLPGLGSAGPRESSYNAPSRHGAISRSRWLKPGLVTVEGFLRGESSADVQALHDELDAALFDAVDRPALLLWERPDGVEVQALVRFVSTFNIAVETPRIWRYQLSLSLDDPRSYTQQILTASTGYLEAAGGITEPITEPIIGADSLGAVAAVNNVGTKPTPPTIRIFGLAVGAQVLLVGTDHRIVLSGTIAAGDYVEIDVAQRTLRLNGTSPAFGMIDSSQTSWFEIPRDNSTIRLLAMASDTGTRAEIDYRHAY